MKYYYNLEIDSKESDVQLIDNIIGVKKNVTSSIWSYSITQHQEDNYYDFINNFLDLLEGKYDELAKLGILRENISIWMIYSYNGQCNMEFDPKRMKRLGDNEIVLCISCYEQESSEKEIKEI